MLFLLPVLHHNVFLIWSKVNAKRITKIDARKQKLLNLQKKKEEASEENKAYLSAFLHRGRTYAAFSQIKMWHTFCGSCVFIAAFPWQLAASFWVHCYYACNCYVCYMSLECWWQHLVRISSSSRPEKIFVFITVPRHCSRREVKTKIKLMYAGNCSCTGR